MTSTRGGCPFCRRIDTGDYRHGTGESAAAASFPPLHPITPGHMLVVSKRHVENAATDPHTTAAVMGLAAALAAQLGTDCNLIASVGAAASQTVSHLHVHLIPRRLGDGLALPWTGQQSRAKAGAL